MQMSPTPSVEFNNAWRCSSISPYLYLLLQSAELKRRDKIVSSPTSYFGGTEFKSFPMNRLPLQALRGVARSSGGNAGTVV